MKKHLLTFLLALAAMPFANYAQVTPVPMGRASNIYSSIQSQPNQVVAHDASNSVLFIHRQDVTIWGGGSAASGRLRYDISVDGGTTFTNDIGPLNFVYSQAARYPQATFYGTDSNPFNNDVVWAAATLDPTSSWDGVVTGLNDVTNGSLTPVIEDYNFIGEGTYQPGGLCQGLPGEFWMTDRVYNGTSLEDTVIIYKGTYNSNTSAVDWSIHTKKGLAASLTFDGSSYLLAPTNVAFSPDGQTGWVALLGDIVGGSDSTFNPILLKSTDAGATWGDPMEVDLRTVNFTSGGTLVDQLQALSPLSDGRPRCAFEFDITVDSNGDPHFFVVVTSKNVGEIPFAYGVNSDLPKLAVDLTTNDGGTTWSMHKVAPILGFIGQFGTPDPNTSQLISMYSNLQVSRTTDGSHIFYSWADSDTITANGGSGFGSSGNDSPNLRIAGKRISDDYVTCPKWVTTNGDPTWGGNILFPTMAPEVLTNTGGSETVYELPVVFVQMLQNDQLAPCQYYYLGNDATITESDFWGQPTAVNTDDCFTNPTVSVAEGNEMERISLFPVPTSGNASLNRLNPSSDNIVEVYNSFGQLVYSDVVKQASQTQLNLNGLADGYYSVRVISEKGMVVKPLILAR